MNVSRETHEKHVSTIQERINPGDSLGWMPERNSKRTLIPGSVTEIRAVFQSEGIITAQIGP